MVLKTEKVIKEWTDYNGHLNVAYYVLIFDIAADVMLDNFKMGGESAKKDKKTTFVAEMHTIYNQEVRLGEEVETHATYVDHDKKRIHYRLSMFHKEKFKDRTRTLTIPLVQKQRRCGSTCHPPSDNFFPTISICRSNG